MARAYHIAKWPENFDPDSSKVLAEGSYVFEWQEQNCSDWDVPLHVHPTGQLIHTLSGTAYVTVRGRSVPVCKGCSMWIPPGIPHCVRLVEGSSLFSFHPGLYLLNTLPHHPQLMLLNSLAVELIKAFCLRREKSARTEKYWQKIVEIAVEEIALSPRLPSLFVTPTRNKKLTTVIAKLDEDEYCSWNNPQWARFLGMSEKSLTRLCRAETGLSFKAFRRHYLMLRSLQLLSEDTAETVAMRVGYENLSSFITAFKEYFGTTPGAFRKNFER